MDNRINFLNFNSARLDQEDSTKCKMAIKFQHFGF